MSNIKIEKLDVELLKEKGINVGKYNKAYEVNKDDFYEEEFSYRGVGYVGAIFHLVNDFIKANSNGVDVVKQSIFIKQFSGAQVEMARGVYESLKEENNEA